MKNKQSLCHRCWRGTLAGWDEQSRQPVSPLQFFTQSDPPGRVEVRPLLSVIADREGWYAATERWPRCSGNG